MKVYIRFLLKIILIFILLIHSINAQWVSNNGPYVSSISALIIKGNTPYAGTNWGVYVPTSNGTSWTQLNTGLTTLNIVAFAINQQVIFAGTNGGGIFLTSNDGANWVSANYGLTNLDVTSLLADGNNLFAGTWGGGVFVSTNNGSDWTPINSGITTNFIKCVAISNNGNLFAGTYNYGVFLSTNKGSSWVPVNSGFSSNKDIQTLAVVGNNVFAGILGSGVYLSTNNGTEWTPINSALSELAGVQCLFPYYSKIFAGTQSGGVFLSEDYGSSWTAVNTGLTNLNVQSLTADNVNLFAGTYGNSGVFRRPLAQIITDVQDNTQSVKHNFILYQNYPNPFNPSTTIEYTIPALTSSLSPRERVSVGQVRVTLVVYDVLGRVVATLVNEEKLPGNYEVKFDAINLPSGVYFYKLHAGGYVETKKMILMK